MSQLRQSFKVALHVESPFLNLGGSHLKILRPRALALFSTWVPT